MLRNLIIERYLCFHKHRRRNLNVNDDSEKFKGFKKNGGFDYILGNKYINYIHTAQNAKVTTARNVYGKTNETEEERFSEAYLEPTQLSTMKLFLRK